MIIHIFLIRIFGICYSLQINNDRNDYLRFPSKFKHKDTNEARSKYFARFILRLHTDGAEAGVEPQEDDAQICKHAADNNQVVQVGR